MRRNRKWTVTISSGLALLSTLLVAGLGRDTATAGAEDASDADAIGLIKCANLVYATNRTSVCFADAFLAQVRQDTHIRAHRRFFSVKLDSEEIFEYPFAVMTGEGPFKLTTRERANMRAYLLGGGFVVVSAGCSSKPWNASMAAELRAMFPELTLKPLDGDHPVFHTVYDIASSTYKRGGEKLPILNGLEVDGKIVLIWSPDGLNDSGKAGPSCCCCGGNEIKKARMINVNLLSYALTH